VALDLEPLTVLVGPNGSGKSAVLAALNPGHLARPVDVWRHEPNTFVGRRFTFSDGATARLVARPGFPAQGSSPVPSTFRYQLLRLDLASLRQANQLQPESRLTEDGGNLANVFDNLTREQQERAAKQICALIPLFGDVDRRPIGGGAQQLVFQDRWNADLWYAPDEVSDGTMLVTAFVMLQYQTPPVSLVAIEEPERGLHPYLLEQLVGLLRKLSRGELGSRPVQVVLATHSPELLQFVEPNEVRFLTRRTDDGSVEVRSVPVNDPAWPRYFDEYSRSLRDAWLSGGLGGVPGAEPVSDA
jgi:predicted ATPase